MRNSRVGFAPGFALACVLAAGPVLAVVEHPAATGHSARLTDPRWLASPPVSDTVTHIDPGAATPEARNALAFAERYGGQWSFRSDPRSGRLALVQGSGIPLQHVDRATKRNGFETGKAAGPTWLQDVRNVEPLVRAFVERNAAWLIPPRGTLVYDADRSLARRDGRLISVRYAWHLDGVPVEGAGVFVGINHGNITRVAARLLGEPTMKTKPKIDAGAAKHIALTYAGHAEYARLEEPQLLIQPEDTPDGRRDYRLIWKMRHVAAGRHETWETRIDAATGAVVGFLDANMYGRVVGSVYPNTVTENNETRVPFPGLAVEVNGRQTLTDAAGHFGYTGGTAVTRLDGRLYDTNCVQCRNPEQPLVLEQVGTGRLDLGRAGHDQNGNGVSTFADRNVFYHLTQVRRIGVKWLPGLRWLGTVKFRANVNVPLHCNAFFDGVSVNFFRSGGGCHNSGYIRDVIQHEWAHGLDYATLFNDGPSGEATADVAALHMSHNPIIGSGFYLDGDPLRILDASISPLGVLTRTRVNFGDCVTPLGGSSFHCVGQLFSQAAWELSVALRERHGPHTGWRVSERLFFESLPDAGSLMPDGSLPVYDAYLQADDDDGNLANGTPHATEIHAAFATHEIAGDPLPQTTHCSRPQQPTVSVQTGCRGIELSWTDVEGAARYRVLRTELREDSPFFPVARVPAGHTTYVDTTVAPGMDYTYVVLAADDAGCESTIENPVHARLPDRPDLSVSAVTVTDAPRGNRSGFADPGEEIDLQIVLDNRGDIEARTVSGTLRSSTSGVDIVVSAAIWPAIPKGQSRPAEGTLRLSTDGAGVACGDLLRLQLIPEDASGCAGETSYFSVRLGAAHGRGDYTCDLTPACFTAPTFAGLELAAPGSSCGETVLSWQPATGHCVDARVTYDIYRSTDAGFSPGPDSLLASRYDGTTYTDSLLQPGATYHYVVRAYDSRAAGEDNTVARSITAPTRPDTGPPRFGGLESAEPGETCGETRLSWSAADESCSLPVVYDVYRSSDARLEPEPDNLIATTASTDFVDFAPEPGRDYAYIVRARDAAGNADPNRTVETAQARNLDRLLFHADFEISGERWEVVEPNDATRGNWEWGDPHGSEIQPEHDVTVQGSRAWITGLERMTPEGDNNDVDQGTTTLLSFFYDIAEAVDPVVRYYRWFTNDRLQNAGDPRDSFLVHASNNDGATWKLLEEVGPGTPLEWVPVEIPLAGILQPSGAVGFRFTASDIGFSVLDASGVEAGIDEFSLIDRDQGCTTCPDKAVVDSVQVDRVGSDLVLTWNPDSAADRRYIIERLGGRDRRPLHLGTTATNTFTVPGGGSGREIHAFRVTAVGGCSQSKSR